MEFNGIINAHKHTHFYILFYAIIKKNITIYYIYI